MTTSPRWDYMAIEAVYTQPFNDLLFQAQTVHRAHFDPNQVQACVLLSIKTGACPENCGYCAQSGHYSTFVQKQRLLSTETIIAAAKKAQANGATRFCMGGAWRHLFDHDLEKISEAIQEVKSLGLEACLTAGMLTQAQADHLKTVGLDYYNHNIDTSPEHYPNITTTHTFQDRLDTLGCVQKSGLKTCSGGIMGMNETRQDRIRFLEILANLPTPPTSVPINRLGKVQGTPLENAVELDPFEFIRTIATARITMPTSFVRLSAGRETMSDELQALCFLAGANSIFMGDTLLTIGNPDVNRDNELFAKLGLKLMDQETLASQ